jgi:hypothetical protein
MEKMDTACFSEPLAFTYGTTGRKNPKQKYYLRSRGSLKSPDNFGILSDVKYKQRQRSYITLFFSGIS